MKRKRIFIPSSVFDNKKLLENDPLLSGQSCHVAGGRGKALLYGSWDSFSGQVFKEWRNDPEHYKDRKWTHVIEPFRIPSYWRIWRGYDYGFAKPLALDGMRQMKTERFIESASIMGAPVNPMWD